MTRAALGRPRRLVNAFARNENVSRYVVLTATFIAERLVPFSALFIPALLVDDAETIGRLEILLTAGVLAAMLGPLGTASAVMHSDFSGRRANWLFAVRVGLLGGALIGGALSLSLGWRGAALGAVLGASVAIYRVSLYRMRVSEDSGPMVTSAITVVLVFGIALTIAVVSDVRLDAGSSLALALASLIAVVPVRQIAEFVDRGAVAQRREMIRFGIPLAVSAGAFWIVAAVDRYGLLIFDDVATVGRYGVIARVVGIVSGLLSTVGLWWQVETMRRGASWGASVKARYLRGIVPAASAVGLLAIWPCALLAAAVIDLPREQVVVIVAWLMGSVVLFAIANTYLALFAARGQTTVVARVWIIAAIANVLLNLALIPVLSMEGAAIATTSAMAVGTLAAFLADRRAEAVAA